MRVLVTGASGFIGRPLVQHLAAVGHQVVATSRSWEVDTPTGGSIEKRQLPSSASDLADIEHVIHLAGLAHSTGHECQEYLAANRDLTVEMATLSTQAGVKGFCYLSTSKVFGTHSNGKAFTTRSSPNPEGHYARSKHLAEQALLEVLEGTGSLRLVSLIRPPVVLGPEAKGNIRTIRRLTHMRVPVPVPKPDNRRSFVSIESLLTAVVDSMRVDPDHKVLRTVVPTDKEPSSTSELVRFLASGRRFSTLPVPKQLLSRLDDPRSPLRRHDFSALYEDFELQPESLDLVVD